MNKETLKEEFEELKEELKAKAENLFDGDDSNSNNIIDRIEHQMLDKTNADKLAELIPLEEEEGE